VADLGVNVDTSQLTALVQQLRKGPEVLRAFSLRVMRKRSAETVANIKRELSGPTLKVRTGSLRRSIAFRVEQEGSDVLSRIGVMKGGSGGLAAAASIGSAFGSKSSNVLRYAAVHEYGSDGPIRPKPPRKLLTIPLKASLTPSGVPRWTALEAKERFPLGTFWRKTDSGSLILFGKKARSIVPLFVGVKQVTIPARPYLRPAVDDMLPLVQSDLQSGLIAKLIEERSGR